MQIGVSIPHYNQYADPESVRELAVLAESLGFDVIWFSEHLALPGYDVQRLGSVWPDALTTMAWVCAYVKRVMIGTDVIVGAVRHPVLSAKILATLDVISRGRLIVGVGSGDVKQEVEAFGVGFDERGSYTDECLKAWQELWSPGNGTFHGRHVRFDDLSCEPKPLQKPHPPIWVGDHAPAVLRRAVEIADGWHPFGLSLAALEQGIDELDRLCERAGRARRPTVSYSAAPGLVSRQADAAVSVNRPSGGHVHALPKTGRLPLSGTPSQVADDLQKMTALGVESALFRFGTMEGSPDSVREQMELIAEAVLPHLASD